MVIETLLDIFGRFEGLGEREAIRFSTDFRSSRYSYRELLLSAGAYGEFLSSLDLVEGDRILLWSENCPEWIFAFWGAVSRGFQIVPIDPGSSAQFAARVSDQAGCKLNLVGERMPDLPGAVPTRRLPRPSELPATMPLRRRASPEDVAEIIFTSGATGTPKGILHRHRSLASNLSPFEAEFRRYRYLAAPFQPIRILCLLPLSHLFGQSMGLFLPPLLGGSVVLASSLVPGRVIEVVQRERVSVLVLVPRILEQLTSLLELDRDGKRFEPHFRHLLAVIERWWHFRSIHRRLGWKFWAIVSGGASLSTELEAAWAEIGILVVQGYGLTEAGPVISVNHPFRARRGSLGRILGGQELRLAENGEIQVRGSNVSLEYLEGGELHRAGSEQDWLPTGDVGELDDQGNLYFKGRKKDVIVTAEGLNVHPEDVETALSAEPGVREAAAVGIDSGRGDEVHAVLVLADRSVDPAEVVRSANRHLERSQRIQHWTVWEQAELPRTSSTFKLRRHAIREAIERGGPPSRPPSTAQTASALLARLSARPAGELQEEERLDEDLGLSSLDRIELLQDLERVSGRRLDETEFAHLQSVGDVERWLEGSGARAVGRRPDPRESVITQLTMPRWATRLPARLLRSTTQRLVIQPLIRHFLPLEVDGLERLARLGETPVILAANHQSHLDAVALGAALPRQWRLRLAPAMQMERFAAHFSPRGRPLRLRLAAHTQYLLACLLFNTYPLPQSGAAFRSVLRYTGSLIDRGYCPLVFPEGRRTEDGRIHTFRPGVALMARELGVSIVPVRIEGLFEVLPSTRHWPERRPVWIGFGTPLRPLSAESPEETARRLRERIVDLKPDPVKESSGPG